MVRRPVAWVTAIVLFAEAIGIALVNWFMGIVVDRQDMSLAGLDSDVMSTSSKVAGLLFGLYFALCGVVALRVALRDRAPAGVGRILLFSAAVVHALLGAFTVGLVGWGAFAFMMVVLGLIVLIFMTYDRREGTVSGAGPDDAKPDGGATGGGAADGGTANGSSGGTPVIPPPAPSAS
ncbi:hypothetical protein AB0H69_46995 [Streptomyces phaeochromogenes]|uniref:hypothetical protein n=1 Tax=Streptomyces phaeochromogenes TaxID=1923 RepID=UPI0033EC21EC